MDNELRFPEIIIFDWDEFNKEKNKIKHNVTQTECEEVFLNDPVYFDDEKHSQREKRYLAYGEATNGKLLTIVFTVRNDKIRVISARNQSKKEREVYKIYKKINTYE